MRRLWLGNAGIVVLALVNVALWLAFPPENDGRRLYGLQVLSEICASTGMTLMAAAIVLSLRPGFLEPWFGGLDKMYKSHKTAGLTGVACMLAHFFTMPGSGEVYLGRDLGKLALIGFLVLVALTLAWRIPVVGGSIQLAYHQWRLSHRLIGAFFILGMVHTFQVKNLLQFAEVPSLYWKIIAYGGASAYGYKLLIDPWLRRGRAYVVEAVHPLNASTVEVALRPRGPGLRQQPGQFVFVSFPGDRLLAEPHPFTVSSAPHDERLRLSIKAAGDWTRQLASRLKPGAAARVNGAYGMFDYTTGGPRQVWVAGGIGVTPFLSWVRSFRGTLDRDISFFYTVRSEADALFWDEFAAAAQVHPRFHPVLNISARDGSLTAERIAARVGSSLAEHEVYLCGPVAMTMALSAQLRSMGVPPHRIHYEEFNFR